MTAGAIVLVDWRDAVTGSGEPNKSRPAVVIGSDEFYDAEFPFRLVVPLTGRDSMLGGAAVTIDPDDRNGCTKRSYALCWCVQAVPEVRIRPTASRVSEESLADIRDLVVACIGR